MMNSLHWIASINRNARRLLVAVPASLLLLGAGGPPAHAAGVVFDFNDATLYSTDRNAPVLTGRDNSTAIATYMDGKLHQANSNWNVTVSGAASSGNGTAGSGYNGEGHVVCQSGPNCSTSNNLSTKDGMPFIMTNGKYTYGGDNAIKMVFSGGVQVTSLSFDFEIFPDAGCQSSQNCPGSLPDFTFRMTDGNGNTIENVTQTATFPSHQYSPISGSNYEKSAQYVGSMTFTFSSVITNPTLYFIDWPDEIGVTNIDWGLPPTPAPEPATLALLASGLIGLGVARRRTARTA